MTLRAAKCAAGGAGSPTVLGWTKANYSMSTGLATLAIAYFIGFAILMSARQFHMKGSHV